MVTLYRRLLAALGLAAGLALLAVAALVGFDVALRNLDLGGLPWAIEVVEYTLYIATFLAAPWVLSRRDHVRLDLVVALLPPPQARRLGRLGDLVGLAVSLLLLFYGLGEVVEARALGSLIFKELIIPEWPLIAVMPLSAALLAVEFVLSLLGHKPTSRDPGT